MQFLSTFTHFQTEVNLTYYADFIHLLCIFYAVFKHFLLTFKQK
jgi:hypothetical protein